MLLFSNSYYVHHTIHLYNLIQDQELYVGIKYYSDSDYYLAMLLSENYNSYIGVKPSLEFLCAHHLL